MITLPLPEREDFLKLTAWLCFKRAPDGTGFNFTRADVLEMEWHEIEWHWQFLRDAWKQEDTARRKASR